LGGGYRGRLTDGTGFIAGTDRVPEGNGDPGPPQGTAIFPVIHLSRIGHIDRKGILITMAHKRCETEEDNQQTQEKIFLDWLTQDGTSGT
jgi:hypothetical protein